MQNHPSDQSAAPPSESRQAIWRLGRVLFLLAATPLTLLALFYAEEDWRGRRDWKQFQAEQAVPGNKIDAYFGSVVPSRVPDDQNFAATPFWKFAPAVVLAPGGAYTGPTNIYSEALAVSKALGFVAELGRDGDWHVGRPLELTRLAEEVTFRAARKIGPSARMPTDDFVKRYKIRVNPERANSPKPHDFPLTNRAAAAEVVLKAIAPFEPVLDELRAASGRPYSRFEMDDAAVDPLHTLLGNLQPLRLAERIVRLRCGVEVALGQAEAARRDLDLGFRLATATASEPIVLAQTFQGAGLESCLQTLWEGMVRHEWTAQQLQDFQARLSQIDLPGQLDFCLRTEQKARMQSADLWRGANPRLFWKEQIDSSNRDDLSSVLRLLPSGWIYFEQLRCAQEWLHMRRSCIDAPRQRIFPAEAKAESRRLGVLGQGTEVLRAGDFTRYGNDYLGLVALFMDRYALRPLRKHQAALRRGDATVWIATFERTAYAQTGVNLGFVACALERYRLAHGEYPEKLGSLVPTFAEKLPDDVVSGKPLLYRRGEGRSYVLYSLGWNEKDDGGQAALYEIVYFTGGVQTKGQRADINQGDWVWAIPAEK